MDPTEIEFIDLPKVLRKMPINAKHAGVTGLTDTHLAPTVGASAPH
jgi:hypothetical protein